MPLILPETVRKLSSVAVLSVAWHGADDGDWLRTWRLDGVFDTALPMGLYAMLDLLLGKNHDNADPQTPEDDLFWHKLIAVIWFPVQFVILLALLWYAQQASDLD